MGHNNKIFIIASFIFFAGCGKSDLDQAEAQKLSEAASLYRNQKFDDSESILGELAKKHPDHVEIAGLRARIKYYTRDFDAAETLLRDLLSLKKENAYALMWLGRTVAVSSKRKEPERTEEAAGIFRSIIKNDPENYQAHYLLGRCLETQGKLELALYEYQMAQVTSEKDLIRLHNHMAELFTTLKLEDRAKKHRLKAGALGLAEKTETVDARSALQ